MNLNAMDGAKRKRVLLVDDHALFRAGMALLVLNNPFVSEVLEADSISSALKYAGSAIQLVLLDHYMPGVTGINGIQSLHKAFPDAVIAIVSGSTSREDISLARDYGADGFISKTVHADDIQRALSTLLRGQRWFPDELAATAAPTHAATILTAKQMEVLALLTEGLSNRAIGKRMEVSENTVRTHVSAVLYALDAKSRAEAVVTARRQGLVQ